jgi:LysM repeat protein
MSMNGLRSRNFVRAGWRLKIPTRKGYVPPSQRRPTYALKREGKYFEYTVRQGDSLWKIANRHRTTTEAIMSLNQLQTSTLRIGQVLLLSPGITLSQPINTRKYVVKNGDSPYLIAKRNQMNLAQFLKINNLTPRSTIFPGQVVKIRIN